jgi:hypothetical protein
MKKNIIPIYIDQDKHPDFHEDNNLIFHYLLDAKKFDVIKYYILEAKIEKNKNIEKLLKTYPNPAIEKLFEMRDLNAELNNKLNNFEVDKQNKKPKL